MCVIVKMNWFQRHINLTALVVWFAIPLISLAPLYTIMDFTSEAVDNYLFLAYLAFVVIIAVWVAYWLTQQKGRDPAETLWIFLPFIG